MTPKDWKARFKTTTILKRQLAIAIDDRKHGELAGGEQYILLIDNNGYTWLEGRPEHGTLARSWFEIIKDLPLKPKEWEPKVGETVVCIDPEGALIEGGLYTLGGVNPRNHICIDWYWYHQRRFVPAHVDIDLAEPSVQPGSDPADTRTEADQAMIRADEYNRVGEAREPSKRERAWEQSQRQAEIASYSVDAICRGKARKTGRQLSHAVRLTEFRAIHPQAMCYHIDQ